MATYTKNINLLKPAEQEKYDVNLRNNNWDKIDKAIGDTSDAIKKHKEADPIDHPDGSVTTPKLKDKCVTPAKLSEELNLKLKNDFVKRSGDTMQGNLTLENGKRIYFNNGDNITHASMYINVANTLDIGVNELPEKAVNRISLCSVEKPQWYNARVGAKVLATEEYVNTETAKYLPLAGGTMKGDLNIATSATIKLQRKAGGGFHTISDGGTNDGVTNLDLGNTQYTQEANLCCYNRPGWYGRNKGTEFRPFLTIPDINVSYGKVNHGDTLPIPAGFTEQECTWLLSMEHSNANQVFFDVNESGGSNMFDYQCWREGRRVHVGTLCKGFDGFNAKFRAESILYDKGSENSYFMPGSANYICIAVKRG